MRKLMNEFKEFAFKGNVFDMAIGVVIGGAFSKIVTSLVNDIIMPLIAVLLGANTFSDLAITLGENENGPILLTYGAFIQNVVDFLIIAACIFTAIKLISAVLRKKEEEKVLEEPKKDPQLELLEEIRDLLKEQK